MIRYGNYIVRPGKPADEPGLLKLYEQVFSSRREPAHWRWKLQQGLDPPISGIPATSSWLALEEESGEPVCHLGGMPQAYRCDGRILPGMVMVDGMCAPDHRRKGLMTTLCRIGLDQWRREGYALAIGLPNQQWGSRTGAVGFQSLFPLRWLIRPLKPERILARKSGLRMLRGLKPLTDAWQWSRRRRNGGAGEPDLDFAEYTDFLPGTVVIGASDPEPCGTLRGSDWFNWRFLACPGAAYRVLVASRCGETVGSGVYRLDHENQGVFGYIADLAGPAEVVAGLARRILAELDDRGAELAATLAVPGSHLYDTLRQLGFVRKKEFGVHIIPLSSEIDVESLRDPGRWHMTGSCFDVI